MEQQLIKKVKYLPWLLASFILIMLVIKISDWRVQVVTNRLQEQYLLEASDFVNALDAKFYNEVQFEDSEMDQNLLSRYIHQLNSYLINNPQLQIFGVKISAEGPVVAITSTVGNPAYKINHPFIDHGDLLRETLNHSKTNISDPVSKPHGEVISVLVPLTNPYSEEIGFVIGIDFPAKDYIYQLRKEKINSLYYAIGVIILLLITIFLVVMRDRQTLTSRRKLRHIETVAVIIIGMPIIFIAIFLSNEFAKKEKNSAFLNISSQQTSALRADFWKIRSSLEVFSNFYSNSEVVDSVEFVSFASQLMDNSPVQSFLWFESNEMLLAKNDNSNKQILLIDGRSFDLRFIHNPSDLIPISEVMNRSKKDIEEIAAASVKNGMTNATETIIIDSEGNTTSYVIVLIAAYSDKKNNINNSGEKAQSGFIAAVFKPQHLFNLAFSKNKWIGEQINIGLVEMNKNSDWLASFPEDHMHYHKEENISEHLKHYNFHKTLPLFAFGRAYGIATHTTEDFESGFSNLRGLLIGISGMIFTLLLAFMIMIWRNRWHVMEKLIELRTAELMKSINDLTCLKAIGEEMSEIHTCESLLSNVNMQLSAAFSNNENINVYIRYKDENYGWTFPGSKSKNSLIVPLLLLGKEVGTIVAETKNNHVISQPDRQLIEQVALMVSRWIEHNEISEALKESEEKFRGLIESAFDAIYILQDKHFTYVNKAFVDLIGYTKEELTDPGFDLDVLLTEKSRELVRVRMEARQKNIEIEPRYEFQQLTKAGEIKDVEVSTVSIKLGGQRKIMGILRDITERKKTEKALVESEERLQQQNEELQVLNEELLVSNSQIKDMNQDLIAAREKAEASDNLKTAFLNNISHEVRTPLNGIVGATILMADPESSDEERAEMSSVVQQSSQRLIRTITQYMDISLLNSGNMPLILSKLNLVSVIDTLLNEFRQVCQKNKLNFEVHLPVDSPEIIVNSDKSLIEKVLYHLLDNAVKFTKEGSIVFKLSMKKDFIKIEISDTGIGIDKEFQVNIFDHFTQEDSSNLRQIDGSGLGLAICKKTCDLLGGRISFQSAKGKGTQFFVELPYDAALLKDKSLDMSEKKVSKVISPFILIAEDEESNFIVLSLLLQKKLNARILRAVTGREAVDLCFANPDLQLVLMDIKMPVMDGFEATRLIKIDRPDMPVIAITAYGLSGDEYKSINAGCDDYIAKPVNTKDLIEKVKTYLLT